jgi:hypothetical protein
MSPLLNTVRYGINAGEQILRGAGNVVSYAIDTITHPFDGKTRTFNKALSQLNPNIPEEYHIIRDSYIGDKGFREINNISTDAIANDSDDMDRELREKTAALAARTEFAKDGKISQILKGFGVNADLGEYDADIYDPEDVPDQFKED